MKARRLAVWSAIGLFVAAFALPAFAATSNVAMKNTAYSPRKITITVGDTVKWTDNDGPPHSVTSNANQAESYDSNPNCVGPGTCMAKGDTFSHAFTQVGTFTYYCRIHGQPNDTSCPMCGTVTVKAKSTPAPTTAPKKTPAPTAAPQHTQAPSQTTAPATAPATTTTPTPSPTPTATPTATPSGSPGLALSTIAPFATPVEVASSGGGRGTLIAIAIGSVILASGGALLLWRQLRTR